MYKYSRMSLGIILFLCPFRRTVLFGFPLGPWAIQSQVLGDPKSIGYGFHLMQWALSPIRYWLVTSMSCVPLLYSVSCREVTLVDQICS